jgi:DNA-cytosine methyltransferase
MDKILRYGSLFTGIDIFGLAAKNEGFETVFGCDNCPYCQLHFKEHNPNALFFEDVKTVESVPRVDVMMFGFPCQNASIASPIKYKNPLDGAQTGLFYEAIRIIRASERPRWLIIENSSQLVKRGLFDMLRELHHLGYHVAWAVLPASKFGAVHRRKRLILLAHAHSFGWTSLVRVWQSFLTQHNERVERESRPEICEPLPNEAYGNGTGKDYGHSYWLFEGLAAKAIGNAIYYPMAQALIQQIKKEIISHGNSTHL